MPRETGNPHNFSERMRDAIDITSAAGEPETDPKLNDQNAEWGDLDDDYHKFPGIKCSTIEETIDYYAQHQNGNNGGDNFRILK
jgi:hypothetical protein